MTLEEIRALDLDGIEARTAEIRTLMDAEDADIEALTSEVDALTQRKAEIAESNKNFAELRAKVAQTNNTIIEKQEETHMKTLAEVRSMQEYIDAYANYIKTGKDTQCRAILTENSVTVSTAKVPVPTIVMDTIQHAWDKMTILSRTTQTDLKGNVKVGVEVASTDAEIHAEGAEAIDEEELTLKIVDLIPETIKKWITVSDETLDMDNGSFLNYIYSELAYKIFKKAEDEVVADIVEDENELTVKSVPAAAVTDFINAAALLSDEAVEPVVIINRLTEAYYRGLAIAANYPVDPFDGMTVLYNNTLPAVKSATLEADTAYGIVGDLSGVQTNFPNGKDVTFKYDDLSLAEKDLVKIVGRMPMGHAIVGFKKFSVLKTEA